MNYRENRRPDASDDRRRNQQYDHRPHDRFGDNYDARRERDDWRNPDRDDRRRFDSPWDQPHQSPQDARRRHDEDDDRRRGFHSYGDYAGSDRGRGYGPGRPESGRADYARDQDRDDARRPSRDQDRRSYHPEGTSGYLQDRRSDNDQSRPGNYTQRDYNQPRRLGYDDARNLPARSDFDRDANRRADRFSGDYRDDFTRRPERRADQSRPNSRRDDDRRESRPSRYDGSNRDGARSDYGYGDDYSSSLYDPTSRNSAFRRHDDDHDSQRRQPDRGRRWSDTPDLDNQPRR